MRQELPQVEGIVAILNLDAERIVSSWILVLDSIVLLKARRSIQGPHAQWRPERAP